MKSIIVAYPNKKIALRLRDVLVEGGFEVPHVCALGSSVLNIAQGMTSGVIVSADILSDMGANMLAESLSLDFDVLALSATGTEYYSGNLSSLSLPLDMDEFLNTVLILATSKRNASANNNDEATILINKAKSLLIKFENMSEMQSHKFLQRESMMTGRKIKEMASFVIEKYSNKE